MVSNRIQALIKKEDGSFTIEASMVFPVIFFALIALLMMSMYTYQMAVIYHAASMTAERTAFRWDNSARDPVSGMGATGRYDGLYWRMTDNGALQTLFSFGGDGSRGGAAYPIGNEAHAAPDSLSDLKLSIEAGRVVSPFQGESRSKGIIEKRIEVKLEQPLTIRPLELLLGHSEPVTIGSASIADPVELIRNVDLVRYYTGKFKGSAGDDTRKQAQLILGGRQVMDHE
ncbi:TadE/TadG family type IV pilus assembly protein [Paenibacillus sp. R14(2021)]|uniref:TadE/TadG family type IV pilus assembly protein n=1 Tax=Paenibacillus sp. R14(2021) TaxID=2859228 RepID=UPI001C611790|nr:TadE family protein [Paenibacillus sp. R14(2021)]